MPNARVLVIAGSDPSGGAGIQGDIKTVTALGGYASAAITALTAQNTQGVFGVYDVPADFVRQQAELVLSDIGADAIKTGMLNTAEIIETLADLLPAYASIPLILDPVMFAKGGAPLLKADALDALKVRLMPLAHVITPNIPEVEHLADMHIQTVDDMKKAAEKILSSGCKSVLVKGGHLDGDMVTDILMHNGTCKIFTDTRLNVTHTHGTGCTLASGIAAGVAQGMTLEEAVTRARAFVRKTMELAPGLGKGHGPLGHANTLKAFAH